LFGVVTIGLDGQHFDSVATRLMYINTGGSSSSGSVSSSSSSSSGGGGNDKPSVANMTWLWVVLAVVSACAFGFLIFAIYRLKNKDDYSPLSTF
jgi:hypothetical protein